MIPALGESRERAYCPLRQRIATRLVEAQHTAAMLTTFNECDMTNVMELRKKHKEAFFLVINRNKRDMTLIMRALSVRLPGT